MRNLFGMLLLLAGPALAEEAPPSLHEDAPADIIVTAPYLRDRADLLSGVSVLTGTQLLAAIRPTIGDTLARQPGVSSTSFGPNASRPVLRGFQGERIRVLTDGIGSFDVSNTSVDHAVVINPLLADRVEVIRGPASLLYGSAAIGGVVNVTDKRIPREVPREAVHVDGQATYGSAAEERSGGLSVDVPLSATLVAHVDGSYLKTGDLRVGGFVLSPALRAQAAANGLDDLATLRGRVPNTAARTWDVAGGLSFVGDSGNAGFTVSHYDSLYGVPIRFGVEPDAEAEEVRLKMRQTRVDARAEVETGGFIERVKFRFGFADYRHSEIDPEGAIGTTFLNKGLEGRLELVQAERGIWRGASGVQLFIRDFEAVGDEAFVPRNETVQFGLFTLQELDFGGVKAEFGGRYERTTASANSLNVRRTFDALSGSAGLSVGLMEGWRLGVNLSRSERAPAGEELFANGPHAGTQAFEIGNPAFETERSTGVEAVLRGKGTGYRFEASAFWNRFSNYIYEDATGEVEDDLPVFLYRQARARYYGVEGELSVTLAQLGTAAINADVLGDYVHAEVLDVGPAPRIPPYRLLGGLEAVADRWSVRAEVEHVGAQRRVTAFETETQGFTLVNASASWRPFDGNRTTLLLSANNIFDVEARRHASFLKDYAPLSGRDVRLTLRFSY
ncbi:TonB-dependent receptor [Sandaracinobacteroides saxicola]|uniref:TonB-dependent receptor n=1 Tax=Sandaracinobacteroides saxicola TaxID=2759707 RepID=A0A7G5IEK3_9SPHN|nr:TonB-dependent receptor [Sandaracinobacteroides saxicola]QMW21795.1 TonB-dependent receptor [Sandaracinobacteroides saxicola]